MRKTFCDKCDKEITRHNEPPESATIKGLVGRPNFELSVVCKPSDGSVFDDLCKYCIADAFAQWDDRPTCGQDYRRLHELLNTYEHSQGSRAEIIQALRNEFP